MLTGFYLDLTNSYSALLPFLSQVCLHFYSFLSNRIMLKILIPTIYNITSNKFINLHISTLEI